MPLPFRTRWLRLQLEHLEDRATPAVVAGLLDRSFSADGLNSLAFTANAQDRGNAVAVQTDGKILVAGWTQGSTRDFAIARFHRNGSLDTSFGNGGKVSYDFSPNQDDEATCIALNGTQILVGGYGYSNGNADFLIARLQSNGQRDASFGTNGLVRLTDFVAGQNDTCSHIALTPGGKVVVVGATSSTIDRVAVAQLTTTGQLDNTFGNRGRIVFAASPFESPQETDTPRTVVVRPNGKIVIGVTNYNIGPQTRRFALVQLNTDGSFDSGFGTGQGRFSFDFNPISNKTALGEMTLQSDGKLVLVGQSVLDEDDTDTVNKLFVARVNANGKALDNTFGTINGQVRQGYLALTYDANSIKHVADGVLVQPVDGKIVVAGSFKVANAQDNNHQFAVYRFTKDGVLDSTFDSDGKMTANRGQMPVNETSRARVALSNEGIVVVGSMNNGTNGADVALMRVHRDPWIAVATGAGAAGTVRILTPTGIQLYELKPYGTAFQGGVQVALTDVNGDSVPEIICAPGAGVAGKVLVYDGLTQTLLIPAITVFAGDTGGINLAVGNVLEPKITIQPFNPASPIVIGPQNLSANTSGPEIVVARNAGKASVVQIYSARTGQFLREFSAYVPTYKGGMRVAVGDVMGSSLDEIITAPMSGNQKVRIFSGESTGNYLRELTPYSNGYLGGYNVVVGNLNRATAKAELVVSQLGMSAPSLPVKVYEVGATATADKVIATYQPFGAGYTRGLRMGLLDADGDGNLDLLATGEQSGAPWFRMKKGPVWEDQTRPFGSTMTASLFLAGDPR